MKFALAVLATLIPAIAGLPAASAEFHQICILNPLPGGENATTRTALLTSYGSALERHLVYGASVALVNPPAWGKTVSSATQGSIAFHRSFAHGFVFRLHLEGLAPGHLYILTLNGNPKLPGNRLLPTTVPGLANERYYDFLFVRTDDVGTYDGDLAVYLRSGDYRVRFYVKDASDFKIVLYHDYFPFRVE